MTDNTHTDNLSNMVSWTLRDKVSTATVQVLSRTIRYRVWQDDPAETGDEGLFNASADDNLLVSGVDENTAEAACEEHAVGVILDHLFQAIVDETRDRGTYPCWVTNTIDMCHLGSKFELGAYADMLDAISQLEQRGQLLNLEEKAWKIID